MKVAILADTHFGIRSDSLAFDATFKTFFEHVFFPTLEARGITHVIHLGDVFDRRKYINFLILNSVQGYFFDQLREREISMHVLLGNHDTYFKNTNLINSGDILIKNYPDIFIFQNPFEREIEGSAVSSILYVPWICPENAEASMKAMEASAAKVCFGHFAIAGFEMHKGMGAEEGFSPAIFSKFDAVYTGHFHHRSSQGNIHYLGCPYEMTWSDYDDPKGFHILDTDTGEMEFVRNPYRMHYKVFYDDSKEQTFDVQKLKDKCVKLIVLNKTDYQQFDRLETAINKAAPLEYRVQEDYVEGDSVVDDEEVDVEDTLDLLGKYVDGSESITGDKVKLKTLLREIYLEAQQPEEE